MKAIITNVMCQFMHISNYFYVSKERILLFFEEKRVKSYIKEIDRIDSKLKKIYKGFDKQ